MLAESSGTQETERTVQTAGSAKTVEMAGSAEAELIKPQETDNKAEAERQEAEAGVGCRGEEHKRWGGQETVTGTRVETGLGGGINHELKRSTVDSTALRPK